MDEQTRYQVTLKDGTTFEATGDGAGNMICAETLEESLFTAENLGEVQMMENGYTSNLTDQALRTFYHQADGSTFIRISDMTDIEKLQAENVALKEENAMLTECVLEMSEIVYGGEL